MKYWINSFPKSGRTWLRHILGQYGFQRDATLNDIRRPVVNGCMVLFRHWDHHARSRTKTKFLWLHRDTLDTFNSFYFWHIAKHGPVDPLTLSVTVIPRIMRFNSYWSCLNEKHKLVTDISYEDMFDAEKAYVVLKDFMGVEEEAFMDAYRRSSFDLMREKEEQLNDTNLSKHKYYGFLKHRGADGDFQSYKTRKGRVGGFWEEQDQAKAISELLHSPGVDESVLAGKQDAEKWLSKA